MNESMGNAMLFNIVITFVIIMVAFFIASLAYSKAYKVKNKIVEEIEKERAYNETVEKEVESWMQSNNVGYRYVTASDNFQCPDAKTETGDSKAKLVSTGQDYQYCVYQLTTCKNSDKSDARCGDYYRVITYMFLDLPVIEDLVSIPVRSETMTFIEVNS